LQKLLDRLNQVDVEKQSDPLTEFLKPVTTAMPKLDNLLPLGKPSGGFKKFFQSHQAEIRHEFRTIQDTYRKAMHGLLNATMLDSDLTQLPHDTAVDITGNAIL
jgi:hypothetical protein